LQDRADHRQNRADLAQPSLLVDPMVCVRVLSQRRRAATSSRAIDGVPRLPVARVPGPALWLPQEVLRTVGGWPPHRLTGKIASWAADRLHLSDKYVMRDGERPHIAIMKLRGRAKQACPAGRPLSRPIDLDQIQLPNLKRRGHPTNEVDPGVTCSTRRRVGN
jgi:hypothetical protein